MLFSVELIAKVFYGWVQARNEADVGGVKPKREAKEDKGLALKKIEQDRVSSLRQMLQERERERKAKQQREDEVLRKGVLARERERAEQERLEKIRKAKAEEERKLELQRAAQARKEEQITSRKKVPPRLRACSYIYQAEAHTCSVEHIIPSYVACCLYLTVCDSSCTATLCTSPLQDGNVGVLPGF